MADEKPQRRLLRLLRRRPKAKPARDSADQNSLWIAHERAVTSVREVGEATQRIASNLAKQRGAVDGIADRARAIASRSSELSQSLRRVHEVFERLAVLALNASLEGARQPEGVGQPLLLIGDEVRSHAARGTELARELESAFGDVTGELAQIGASVESTKDTSHEASSESARAGSAASNAERALQEVRESLRRTTGTDPETMRALAEAAEHARALVTSLGTLSGKVPEGLVASVLRPAVEPLLRLLAYESDEDDS
ncbi:MAG: hypothetical protein HOO96_01950 [Polyangiaceae bacterium]|jgi:methyl-accepting chemotaxis protein|nr:hypothetical protein [Polyangiaceae bacterium]